MVGNDMLDVVALRNHNYSERLELESDWLQHSQHSRSIFGVHSFIIRIITREDHFSCLFRFIHHSNNAFTYSYVTL